MWEEAIVNEQRGRLVVISGPSGAGKSTVISRLMQRRQNLCFSVSATTRQPRPGELDGKDYFFVTRDAFDRMIEADALLEHAEYVGSCYGTPRDFVIQRMNSGIHVILDIEVQGARQVYKKMPDAIMIFLVPPSLKELELRLSGRGTDSPEKIRGRLERALAEYSEAQDAGFYQYIIVNDDPEVAAMEIDSILTAEQCRFSERKYILSEV